MRLLVLMFKCDGSLIPLAEGIEIQKSEKYFSPRSWSILRILISSPETNGNIPFCSKFRVISYYWLPIGGDAVAGCGEMIKKVYLQKIWKICFQLFWMMKKKVSNYADLQELSFDFNLSPSKFTRKADISIC